MHPLTELTVPEGSVAIHWFEQSSYAIKDSQGTTVFVDPYFPHDRPAERFVHDQPPVDEAELPVDFVLLTHDHLDHTHAETLRRVLQASPAAIFAGPVESIARVIGEVGVAGEQTMTLQVGDAVMLGTMEVHVVYAKLPGGDPAAGIKPPDVTHLGYVVRAGERTLYFTGDPMNNFAEQEELVHAVAMHRPEIGFMTTHPTEGEFPFFAGCVSMAEQIGLRHVVPAHRSCFVKRDYDPQVWAGHFRPGGPQPIIIPHNSHILYDGAGAR
ncbi:MAG: MBL fold metallo-hydrolase [Caldilineaceae bacterium]|nr:MBL fold metallo-hydrolase [Caldilineaceae bacterium]